METITETLAGPGGGTLTVLRSSEARGMRRVPAHLRFLSDHWPGLAAAAYAGFTKHGAGAVVVFGEPEASEGSLRLRLSRAARPFRAQRLWYATSFDGLPRAGRDWTAMWETARLDSYDPEHEGLVLFLEGEALPRGYVVSGSPPPPAAFANAQAMLN
jgi:hypothetical protein